MECHSFEPEVGLRDIIKDQDPSKYKNLYVHLPKNNLISQHYDYQDTPLGNITHEDFHSRWADDAHWIQRIVSTTMAHYIMQNMLMIRNCQI